MGGLEDSEQRGVLDYLVDGLGVVALEAPFDSDTPGWLLDPRPEDTELVLTLIGGTVTRVARDPSIGLASSDEDGRQRSLEYVAQALTEVRRANDRGDRARIRAVELHTAPRGGTAAAFATSLEEIASWDWEGARVLIEHCDAPRPGPTAKGFLELETELDVIASVNTRVASDIGVVINWGRSAIEGRSVETPLLQAQRAREVGLLAGVVLSGCSDRADSRGGAWADVHLGVADPDAPADPSLMTEHEVARFIGQAGDDIDFVGAKISCGPAAPIGLRLTVLERSLRSINRAVVSGRGSDVMAG